MLLCVLVCWVQGALFILAWEECYALSYQYLLPEDKSVLRMLSVPTMTLLSVRDLASHSMKEKKALIETTVPSTSSVSGLWKPGCPWVPFTDILSASYLHLHISINKWSVAEDLWHCFCMDFGLWFIPAQKHFPSVSLSLSFYTCVYLSSFPCLAVISVY